MLNRPEEILRSAVGVWPKCATNMFGVLVFTITQATADFGPQRIISSNATEVIDAFPADMDGDGDIDVLAAKPGSPFGGAASSFIVIMEMAVLRSSIINFLGVQRLL